jgi:MMP 1-O-methyltransferase
LSTPPPPTPTAERVLEAARAATGFMPDDEGLALSRVAGLVGNLPAGEGGDVIIEVGAYCGRSTLYLTHGILAAASGRHQATRPASRTIVFSVDHHHGSEENQAGWEHHDPALVDPDTGRLDTLGRWRAAVEGAGVENEVVAMVGDSPTIAARWTAPAGLVFIDGGHGAEPAWADYRGWAPRVAPGGWLAIHDVFPDPADGGRPPYELYCRAVESGAFTEEASLGCGSLRVLRRQASGY